MGDADGWIPCVLCYLPIPLDEYRTARCWTDPDGITCAAHGACLTWVGEPVSSDS